jgi:hypothetical protein
MITMTQIRFKAEQLASSAKLASISVWNGVTFVARYPVPRYTRFGLYSQAIIVVGCLFCFQWWPLIPTVAIGFLGVVAAVMTVRGLRPERFSLGEQVFYLLIIFCLFIVEMRSVYKDRDRHDKEQSQMQLKEEEARAKESASFAALVREGHGLLASMQHVDTLEEEALKNITGGDSFAYVSPQNFSGEQFAGLVWNNGEQALIGLTLTIAHTSDPVQVWGAAFFKPIFIGTVGPHDHAPIPEFVFQPRADIKTGQDNYWIMLSAQNGTVQQSLYFRRNKLHPERWAYSFQVERLHDTEKPQREKNLTKIDNRPRKQPSQELLLFRAWSDDMEAAASQKR